jgi:hypothetical protein
MYRYTHSLLSVFVDQLTYFPLSMAHCVGLQFCSIANNPIIDEELIEAHVLGVEKVRKSKMKSNQRQLTFFSPLFSSLRH